MSLISCPSCQARISNKVEICPKCGINFNDDVSENDLQRAKILKYRRYRNKMYQYKMLSFVAIAIATIGAVPMIWNYIKALDYGFAPEITNHWGVNFIVIGFLAYVCIRILMILTKMKHRKSNV